MDHSKHLLAPGTILGRHRIVRPLGSGGMGVVYEAEHQALKKRVAIKTLHAAAAIEERTRTRFLREGEAASKIRHPNVVDISDIVDEGPFPYLVMEFLVGETLEALIDREGPLPLPRVVELMLPVLSAVAAAHEEGVIHRDLKPANIFLCRQRDGTVLPKVLDFGISKISEPQDEKGGLTGSGAVLGTPHYMSPEQVRGSRDVSAASDQYALGVILYQCVTGRRPIAGETLYEIMIGVVTQSPAPPSALRPELPANFDALVLRTLAKGAEDRFDSVEALSAALATFRSGSTETFDPLAPPATPRPPRAIAETLADSLAHTVEDSGGLARSVPRPPDTLNSSSGEKSSPGRPASRKAPIAVAVGVAIGVAVTAGVRLRMRPAPSVAPTTLQARPAVRPPAPAPTPVIAPAIETPTPTSVDAGAVAPAPVAVTDPPIVSETPHHAHGHTRTRDHHPPRTPDRGPGTNSMPVLD